MKYFTPFPNWNRSTSKIRGLSALAALVMTGAIAFMACSPLAAQTASPGSASTAAESEETPQTITKDEWPCVWIKVVHLDAATIWDGPSIKDLPNWRNDNEVRGLSQYLISRRIPAEEVEKQIKEFAQSLPEDKRDARLTLLFAAVLERTNEDRALIIDGIERFHKRQLARADKIEAEGLELPDISAPLVDEPISATEVDKLSPEEEKYNWDVRVFTERQKNMPLACEIPQLMNERAGLIARTIRSEMSE